jgi:transposase-like protein
MLRIRDDRDYLFFYTKFPRTHIFSRFSNYNGKFYRGCKMTRWKCPECKNNYETEGKGKNATIIVLCGCGYYMDKVEEEKNE